MKHWVLTIALHGLFNSRSHKLTESLVILLFSWFFWFTGKVFPLRSKIFSNDNRAVALWGCRGEVGGCNGENRRLLASLVCRVAAGMRKPEVGVSRWEVSKSASQILYCWYHRVVGVLPPKLASVVQAVWELWPVEGSYAQSAIDGPFGGQFLRKISGRWSSTCRMQRSNPLGFSWLGSVFIVKKVQKTLMQLTGCSRWQIAAKIG